MTDSKEKEDEARDANDERLRNDQRERWAAQDKYLNDITERESENNRAESVHQKWLEHGQNKQRDWEQAGRAIANITAKYDKIHQDININYLEKRAQIIYKIEDLENRIRERKADSERGGR